MKNKLPGIRAGIRFFIETKRNVLIYEIECIIILIKSKVEVTIFENKKIIYYIPCHYVTIHRPVLGMWAKKRYNS